MEIAGTQLIPAPRPAVWDALNDPDTLKRCLPGCESVERQGEDAFKVVVAAAIGPLRARFTGSLRMADARPPSSCVMIFEGQGGPVGFGKGSATVELQEADGQTRLGYTAEAQVGGKLAQIGSRMIDSVAKKMSDDFFKAFVKQFDAAPADAPVDASVEAVPRPAGKRTEPVGVTRGAESLVAAPIATPFEQERPPAAAHQALPTAVAGLVPGWWLAVAAVLGSAFTVVGAVLVR